MAFHDKTDNFIIFAWSWKGQLQFIYHVDGDFSDQRVWRKVSDFVAQQKRVSEVRCEGQYCFLTAIRRCAENEDGKRKGTEDFDCLCSCGSCFTKKGYVKDKPYSKCVHGGADLRSQ